MVHFTCEKLSPSVTRIFAPAEEQMYLVTGAERAALIDTGAGVGDLRAYVHTLTELPLIVLLTHNHFDHALGAAQFETVYMSRADVDEFDAEGLATGRVAYLSEKPVFPQIEASDYIPVDDPKRFRILSDGDVFDLGGVHIEARICGGHTPGSMTFLLTEERTLITSDAVSHFSLMQGSHALGMCSYEKNLIALDEATKGRYDRIYCSHDAVIPPVDLLRRVIEVCEEIKAGTDDRVPFGFLDETGMIAKATCSVVDGPFGSSEHMRADGGFGNMVYDPARIWE